MEEDLTRIAVVGSGIAGTTCAKALHTLGYDVEIFEMTPKDSPTRPRQMEGSVHFLENVPELQPSRNMKRLEIRSPNFVASLKGNIGFFYEVGGENGIEAKARKDIERLIPIHYGTRVRSKRQLEDEFDVIVAADGYRSRIAEETGLRSRTPKQVGTGVGLTIKGDFDPEWMAIWLDNYLSSHGYAYVIPFSKCEASLISASIWKRAHFRVYRKRLKKLAVSRGWKVLDEWVDFVSWYDFSSYHRGNLYIIGNAGSFTDPAFGFGLKWAIKSAQLCAKAIHQNLDYDLLLDRELLPEFSSWQVMRKIFESANNKDYDRFVNIFNRPYAKNLVESGESICCTLKPREAAQNIRIIFKCLGCYGFLFHKFLMLMLYQRFMDYLQKTC